MIKKKKINKFLIFILIASSFVYAQERLDSTFGPNSNGIVTTSINSNCLVNSIAQQSDGKIVGIGYDTTNDGKNELLLLRYNNDGSLDTSFGSNGVTNLSIGSNTQGESIALQNDGKILCSGFATNNSTQFLIARFYINGTLDNTFGSNGIVTTVLGQGSDCHSLKIQADGKVVAAGVSISQSGSPVFTLVRYNVDGSLDNTFGNNGIVTTQIGNSSVANSLEIDSNGNILVVGKSDSKFALARYDSFGNLDTSFGNAGYLVPYSGIVTTSIGSNAAIQSVVIQSDNKIVAGGFSDDRFALARYNSNGSLDTSFGSDNNGIVLTSLSNQDRINSIAINSNNEIVACGSSENKFSIICYDNNGSINSVFTPLTNAIGSSNSANYLLIQADKYLAAGYSDNQIALIRYKADPNIFINLSNPVNQAKIISKIFKINGTSSSKNSTVKVFINDVLFATTQTDNSTGNWSAGLSPVLNDGTYKILVQLFENNNVVADNQATINIDTTVASSFAIGNALRVDQIFGNDTNGVRFGPPFATINAALEQAQAGDAVLIYPGTYNEKIIIPNGVSVFGAANCIIQQTDVVTNTDLVTMGENSSLTNVSLILTSTQHVHLRGVVFPGTTTQTAKLKLSNLVVNNAGASSSGSSNVYGIHSNGTGLPLANNPAVINCFITVSSIDSGIKRGILVDSASNLYLNNCQIISSGIGVETNNVNAKFGCNFTTISGNVADISQTLGLLTCNTSILYNFTTNGQQFNTNESSTIIFSDPGTLIGGVVKFMRPGTGASSVNEVQIKAPRNMLINSISIKSLTAPGAGNTDTWTLRKNGIDTSLTVSLSNGQTNNVNNYLAIVFNKGDYISVKVQSSLLTSTTDFLVTLNIF